MPSTSVRRIAASDGMLPRKVRLRALREAPYAFEQILADVEADPDEEWIEWAIELAADDGRSVAFLAFGEDPAAATGMAGALLSLWVTETSEPASRLYGSLGFEERGRRKPHAHVSGRLRGRAGAPVRPLRARAPSAHSRA